MQIMWAEFSERPFLDTYNTLEKHPKRSGTWPDWRERALAEIRLRIAKGGRHLEALRAKYKIKRNFIKLVEQKRKSLYLT